MRNIMIMAAFMIGIGTFMAQIADKMAAAHVVPSSQPSIAAATAPTSDASNRSLRIPRDEPTCRHVR